MVQLTVLFGLSTCIDKPSDWGLTVSHNGPRAGFSPSFMFAACFGNRKLILPTTASPSCLHHAPGVRVPLVVGLLMQSPGERNYQKQVIELVPAAEMHGMSSDVQAAVICFEWLQGSWWSSGPFWHAHHWLAVKCSRVWQQYIFTKFMQLALVPRSIL